MGPIIYVCSESEMQMVAAQYLANLLQANHTVRKLRLDYQGSVQPVGTLERECRSRLNVAKKILRSESKPGDIILSFLTGFRIEGDRVYDVCCMGVECDSVQTYESFGYPVHPLLYEDYVRTVPVQYGFLGTTLGPEKSFSEYMEERFRTPRDNWMGDLRFGNMDRITQIQDCIHKYLINTKKSDGIQAVIASPVLATVLMTLLKRFIGDNYDTDSFDSITAADPDSVFFAPQLAMTLGKGFVTTLGDRQMRVYVSDSTYPTDPVTEHSDVNRLAIFGNKLGAVIGGVRDYHNLDYDVPAYYFQTMQTGRTYTLSDTDWLKDGVHNTDISVAYMPGSAILGQNIIRRLASYLPDKEPADIFCKIDAGKFSNGETRVRIVSNVRNKHMVLVCQARTGHINDDLMELYLMLDACGRSDVAKITVVLPYLPYSRSDKKDEPRTPIASAHIISTLSRLGIDNLISLDLHSGQLQGMMPRGFHNLYMKPYLCDHIYNAYLSQIDRSEWNDRFVLIAPDAGSGKTIRSYSETLGIQNIIMDKTRDYSKPGTVVRTRIIGNQEDVQGKTGILIDDMADTMGTMVSAAESLVAMGMQDILIIVTHGILSGDAIERINQSPHIREVVVTNSLPQRENLLRSHKIRVVSCAELIARAVDGILSGRSVSQLFE